MRRIKRKNYKKERIPLPDLLVIQVESFKRFLQEGVQPEKRIKKGLQGVFLESFPIEDIHGRHSLEFVEYRVGTPKYSPSEAKRKKLTHSAPLWATLRLVKKKPSTGDGEGKLEAAIKQEVYLCDLPYMTDKGTFIINGVERVVVNQLHRSPGVYYSINTKGTTVYRALLVPYRGPWIDFTIDGSKILGITISKRRKIPITRLLRALGINSTSKILNTLLDAEKLSLSKLKPVRHVFAEDVVDPKTGEVVYEAGNMVEENSKEFLKRIGIKKINVFDMDDPRVEVALTTNRQDRIKDEKGALGNIYRTLRYTPPKDEQEARQYIESFFFSRARFYLGEVGRFKINQRLGLDLPLDQEAFTREDLIAIVKHLLLLYINEEREEDMDDLANRRVRRVGELLYEQFRIAFLRLNRVIKERMLLEKDANISPKKLVNPRLVTSSILSFFTSDRLSQFLDQTNPLAELTHKRRLSALGRGGLTRATASFEVRDVHPSHYGRLCPIETPEGQNIGLITSLTNYARIDQLGFVVTPLLKVKNGRITKEVKELTPFEEQDYKIASADVPFDPKTGEILVDPVWARYRGGYPLVRKKDIDFIDVSPRQLISPSASLIPFLEHDDANRALMGCNMQRQAVPLLRPEAPIVGTGLEEKVARDSGAMVIAKRGGVVRYVDASQIIIEPKTRSKKNLAILEPVWDIYKLTKYQRSNQNTVLNQKPLVKPGDVVKKDEILADGSATSNGELALGHNLLVAFIPYFGYNFEDAVVVSERVLKEDIFTSIQILEFEVEVRETKLGPEEITKDLPNVSEEALKNLDQDGIVRIGAEVKAEDILVGKVSPKAERELSPEERLIYAIFAEKAKDVKDTSKRVPPGIQGVVTDVIVLSRRKDHPIAKRKMAEKRDIIEKETRNEKLGVENYFKTLLVEKLKGEKIEQSLKNEIGEIVLRKGEEFTEGFISKENFLSFEFPLGFLKDSEKESEVRNLILKARSKLEEIEEKKRQEIEILERGDELPPGVLQLVKVYVAQKRKLQAGDKLSGRHGNKGVVAKIAPEEDMPFMDDGTHVDIVLNPLGVPSRMNVGQILETILGWAGKKMGVHYAAPAFESMPIEYIRKELRSAGLPENGKVNLRDGRTGDYLHYPVTVGYIYMSKLIHMVEDKVHARATGPYSLITQQPVGGKSHFGGQRFGEMEVWALEAYGAAHTLQEMITVKSDDIKGRNQLYQSIIKGEEPPEPGLPASFEVLLKELQGLALNVDVIEEKKRGENRA